MQHLDKKTLSDFYIGFSTLFNTVKHNTNLTLKPLLVYIPHDIFDPKQVRLEEELVLPSFMALKSPSVVSSDEPCFLACWTSNTGDRSYCGMYG